MIFVVVATQFIQLVYAGNFFAKCSALGGTPYASYDDGTAIAGTSAGVQDCDFSKLVNPGDCLKCSEVCRKTSANCAPTAPTAGTCGANLGTTDGLSASLIQALGELFECTRDDTAPYTTNSYIGATAAGTYFTGCPAAGSETPVTTQNHCLGSDGSLTTTTTSEVGSPFSVLGAGTPLVAGTGAILLTAAAPSGLGLFGGAGIAGQPGITLGGGGILPAAAFTVVIIYRCLDTFHAMQNLILKIGENCILKLVINLYHFRTSS